MSRDMADSCLKTSRTLFGVLGLVDPVRIDHHVAEQLALGREHPDVAVGHQDQHPLPAVRPTDADRPEPALVAHSIVRERHGGGGEGGCLDLLLEGRPGRAAILGSMRADVVVVRDEAIQLSLELGERGGRVLFGQVPLQRLVETLYLPAGLRRRFQGVCARSWASFSDGFMNPRVARGRSLRLLAIWARSRALKTERSVPLGMYWRNSPLVFSFEPRCQGLRGSQK